MSAASPFRSIFSSYQLCSQQTVALVCSISITFDGRWCVQYEAHQQFTKPCYQHQTDPSETRRVIGSSSVLRILSPQQQQRLGSVAPSTAAWQATIGSPSLSSSPSTPSSTPSSSPSVHGNLLYIPFKMVSLHHQNIYNFTSSAFPKDLFSLNQKKIIFFKTNCFLYILTVTS